MFKNRILKKISAGLMAGLCAFTLIGTNLGGLKTNAAETAKEPRSQETRLSDRRRRTSEFHTAGTARATTACIRPQILQNSPWKLFAERVSTAPDLFMRP